MSVTRDATDIAFARYDTTAPSGHRQFVPSDTAMRRFELPSET